MVEWLFADVLLVMLLLGFKGASTIAIPIGSLLMGAITFVSGRVDLDWLFCAADIDTELGPRLWLLFNILFRSFLLATADFEIGRSLAWGLN